MAALLVAACGQDAVVKPRKAEPAYAGPLDAGVVRTASGSVRGQVASDGAPKREQVVFRRETERAHLPLHLTAYRVSQVLGHPGDLVADTLALAGEMLSCSRGFPPLSSDSRFLKRSLGLGTRPRTPGGRI